MTQRFRTVYCLDATSSCVRKTVFEIYMGYTRLNSQFKRLAVEMMQPGATQSPALISESHLDRIAAFVKASPSVAIVDLGIQATPTAHPAFASFARLTGEILRERRGVLVIWCDATTDRSALAAVAEAIGPIVIMPLPAVETSDLSELAGIGNVFIGNANRNDSYGLGVPLAARPDAKAPVSLTTFRGGCPIIEQRALFVGCDGREFACQRQMLNDEPLADQPQEDPASQVITAHWQDLRHLLRLDRRDEAMRSCADCTFSYQQCRDDAQVRAFWTAQDDRGDVVDVAEREYLFGRAIPTPQRVLKVDLGCGPVKRSGFLGIDRFPLPGVDIVADVNKGIPLPDDSVDYLVASHSLEHFTDLPHVIHEIHRVCKDRALVTIVAPYSATGLNLANPYHVQVFNEHTARFFTNAAETALQRPDYDFPSAFDWGLASSDHSDWRADLRLLKCEFFYMPAYRGLDEPAKRVLRQSLNDVCEQMVLQLLVVKTPISTDEFSRRMCSTVYQEPPAITARRVEDAVAGEPNLFTELAGVPRSVSDLNNTAAHFAKRITAVNTELIRRDHEHRQKAAELEKRLVSLQEQLEGYHVANRQPTTPDDEPAIAELIQSRRIRAAVSREFGGDPFSRHVRHYRRRAQDLTNLIAPNLESLKEFGRARGWIASGFRLQESDLWSAGQEWLYDLPVENASLVGIKLAVTAQFAPSMLTPLFNCTVLSEDSATVLANADLRVGGNLSLSPLELPLGPVDVTRGFVRIRLVGLPAIESLGIRTLEWRKLNVLRQVRRIHLFCEPIYG